MAEWPILLPSHELTYKPARVWDVGASRGRPQGECANSTDSTNDCLCGVCENEKKNPVPQVLNLFDPSTDSTMWASGTKNHY